MPFLLDLPPLPTTRELMLIAPELLLTFFACAALVIDIALPRGKKHVTAYFSLAGIGVVAISLVQIFLVNADRLPLTAFYGMVGIDGLSLVFRGIFLLAAALSIMLSIKYLDVEGEQRGEYYAMILFATTGMMFMAIGSDLISLYVALELMALSVYVLVGYLKRNERANEGAMKYFLMGIFSSGVLLYGMSLLYGVTGVTNLSQISATVADIILNGPSAETGDPRLLLFLALALIGAGLLFKVAAVPFHMWAPDAYEGAPTSVTAFMSVGPKAAAYVLLVRVLLFGLGPLREMESLPGWAAMLGIVAAATMTIGNLAAVTQENVKRLLAYSSISHAGYVLLGVLAGTQMGYQGVVFHLTIYTLVNTGAFGVILTLHRKGIIGDKLDDLNGLFAKAPTLAAMMLIFMLSLAGIPTTAGFIGKYLLFGSLIQSGKPWMIYLVLIAVVNTAISFYYYARFIRAMFLNPLKDEEPLAVSSLMKVSMAAAAALVMALGVYPQPLIKVADVAAQSIPLYKPQASGVAAQ
jgi:NADH-quinone oxidoreductase subunit N